LYGYLLVELGGVRRPLPNREVVDNATFEIFAKHSVMNR
jgi:hypothetical protein